MPINDLNLEFEDEEEQKEKKSEAVHLDVDLEFQSQSNFQKRPVQLEAGAPRKDAVVRPIESARPGGINPAAKMASPAKASPSVMGATALKMEPQAEIDSQEVVELREKMRQVEINSEVKVQIAEFKTEYLTELLSDMKLMEHQIGQLLLRINAKHPESKNEVLMIKKILADFTSKKRK